MEKTKEIVLPDYLVTFKTILEEVSSMYQEKLTRAEFESKKNSFQVTLLESFLSDTYKEFCAHQGKKFLIHFQGTRIVRGNKHTFGIGWDQIPQNFDICFTGVVSSVLDQSHDWGRDFATSSIVGNNKFPITTQATGFMVKEKFGLFHEWKTIYEPFYFIFIKQNSKGLPEWCLMDMVEPIIPLEFKELKMQARHDLVFGNIQVPTITVYIGNTAVDEFFTKNPDFK